MQKKKNIICQECRLKEEYYLQGMQIKKINIACFDCCCRIVLLIALYDRTDRTSVASASAIASAVAVAVVAILIVLLPSERVE